MRGKRLQEVVGHIEKANRLRKISVVLFTICAVIVLVMVMARSLTFDVRIFGFVIAFWFLTFGIIARVSASREDKEFFNEFEG